MELISLHGVGASKFFNMEEVEIAVGTKEGCNLTEAVKEHIRTGPCGASWMKPISKENAGVQQKV